MNEPARYNRLLLERFLELKQEFEEYQLVACGPGVVQVFFRRTSMLRLSLLEMGKGVLTSQDQETGFHPLRLSYEPEEHLAFSSEATKVG